VQDKDNSVKLADQRLEIEQIFKRLDMLNHRLDDMDSVITSLVERVMGRPLTVEVTCPKCGEIIQINITSSVRLRGKG
jgi:tRNA(Ser,Leu) C12 N-acetylase TAN1